MAARSTNKTTAPAETVETVEPTVEPTAEPVVIVRPHVDPDATPEVLASQARAALDITDDMLSPEGLSALALSQAEGQAKFAYVVYTLGREPFGLTGKEISALTEIAPPSVSKLRLAGSLLARCGPAAQSVARQATALGQKYNQKEISAKFDALSGDALIDSIVSVYDAMVEARKAERSAGTQTAAEKEAEAAEVAAKVAAERTPGKRLGRALDALTAVETVEAEHRATLAPLAVSVVAEGLRIAALCGLSAEAVVSSILERAAEAEARAAQAEIDAAHVSTMAAAV